MTTILKGKTVSADRTLEFEGIVDFIAEKGTIEECHSELTTDHRSRQRTSTILIVVAEILFPMIIALKLCCVKPPG
jgi:hypothetical protein